MGDEPIATGTLAKTPLPHLLIYLDQRQLSGTLAVWPDVVSETDKRQDRILLLKGRPVAGRLIESARTLREGMLKLFYRSEAPYAFYEGNLLGDAEGRLNGRLDPLSLITESLRATGREDVINEVLGRVGELRLRMQPRVEINRFELNPDERALIDLLMAEPATIADLIAGSSLPASRARRIVYLLLISKAVAPYDDAVPAGATGTGPIRMSIPGAAPAPAGAAPPPAAAAAPAAAAVQAFPDAAAEPEQPAAAAPAAAAASTSEPSTSMPPLEGFSKPPPGRLDRLAEMPSPPEGLSPELSERWQRITTRGRLIENQNYYEMLGVDKKVQSADVKTEFFKLAKEWHPDRLPPDLAPLRPFVEIIFSFMNEAHKVLSDEEQRLAYLRTVREGGGTPAAERLMQSILDSALAYERVQVFARKHQYDEALELLQRILSLTKDEPDYHAMYAWLLMQKHSGPDSPNAKILESLDKAIALYEDHEKAHTYKADLYKRMGRHNEALREYKKVAQINPKNVEAAREVRIAQMREEKDRPSVTKGAAAGLLGKLFGGGDDKDKGKEKPKSKKK
jgi:curved DNA-binding protein CbpA